MSAAHEAGPWQANRLGEIRDQRGDEIAHVFEFKNLGVIAAAPELLAALQAIVKSLADHDDDGMVEYAEQMIASRNAIAKATGEAA